MTEPSLLPTLNTAALAPQSMSGDGVSGTNRSLSEVIEADKYIQGSAALTKRRFGMQVQKFRPGSALGDSCR